MNSEELNKTEEQRFSELLKDAEEPFNESAWELYLSSKGKLNHENDPKPFRPSPFKGIEFYNSRNVLPLFLTIITIAILWSLLSKKKNTSDATQIEVSDSSKTAIDTLPEILPPPTNKNDIKPVKDTLKKNTVVKKSKKPEKKKQFKKDQKRGRNNKARIKSTKIKSDTSSTK